MHVALAVTLCAFILPSAHPAAAAGSPEPWLPSGEMRTLLEPSHYIIGSARPMAGIDFPSRRLVEPASLPACGLYGLSCPREAVPQLRPFLQGAQIPPINTGFKALGTAGQSGKIDGPGKKGNGSYRVVKNEPYELSMEVHTGYIDGVTTFKREPATGRDTAAYSGRLWDGEKDAWGPPLEKLGPVEVVYGAGEDSGKVRWVEDGQKKEEGYWGGGRDGKRSMTIEFGGGWDHDFVRD